MTDFMMKASGWPCPLCGCEQADIVEMLLPQIILRCVECTTEYAVEG